MINVVLLGATGRMGQLVAAEVAATTDMALVGTIPAFEDQRLSTTAERANVIEAGDIVIDFSAPDGTAAAIPIAVAAGIPFVIGVTGLSDAIMRQIDDAARTIPIFVASNFSLGVQAIANALPFLVRALPGAD